MMFPRLNVYFIVMTFLVRRTYFDNCVSQHLSGAGSSPAGSISRDLNSQKLHD